VRPSTCCATSQRLRTEPDDEHDRLRLRNGEQRRDAEAGEHEVREAHKPHGRQVARAEADVDQIEDADQKHPESRAEKPDRVG
jgi:hypothetical protein